VFRTKFLRIDKGWSQRQLAKLIGLRQSTISSIESGRVNPNDVERQALALVLGCKPEQLLDHVSAASLDDGAEFVDGQRAKAVQS